MLRSLLAASSSLGQFQLQLDTISNNIANVNTTGYKRREATFGELLTQQFLNVKGNVQNDNAQTSNDPLSGKRDTFPGIRYGTGTFVNGTALSFQSGPVMITNRNLDMAITDKNTFLRVQVEKNGRTEVGYTRDGNLQLSPTTNPQFLTVTTTEGYPVLGNNTPILIPSNARDVVISPKGEIIVTTRDGVKQQVALSFVSFQKPQLLEGNGGNIYRVPETITIPQDQIFTLVNPNEVEVQSGALEGSNADLTEEMTDLMVAQKAYQFGARVITTSDQMLGLINGLRS